MHAVAGMVRVSRIGRGALAEDRVGAGGRHPMLVHMAVAVDADQFLVGRIPVVHVRQQRLGRKQAEAQHEGESDETTEHGAGPTVGG